MAVFADIGCLDVHQALSSGRCAVVAADAISDDSGMVEQRGKPPGGVVTVVALIVRRYMSGGFTCRLHTVVAGYAAARQ